MKSLLIAVMSVALIAGSAAGIATADDKGDKRHDKKIERHDVRDRDYPGASPRTAAWPADKDACKNGGWRNFPHHDFKNQGECVSAVNRHARDHRKSR